MLIALRARLLRREDKVAPAAGKRMKDGVRYHGKIEERGARSEKYEDRRTISHQICRLTHLRHCPEFHFHPVNLIKRPLKLLICLLLERVLILDRTALSATTITTTSSILIRIRNGARSFPLPLPAQARSKNDSLSSYLA